MEKNIDHTAAWQTHRKAVQATDQLERKLKHGAAVEDGSLAWDPEMGMVRSKKFSTGSV